jgi:hypothetical protein
VFVFCSASGKECRHRKEREKKRERRDIIKGEYGKGDTRRREKSGNEAKAKIWKNNRRKE